MKYLVLVVCAACGGWDSWPGLLCAHIPESVSLQGSVDMRCKPGTKFGLFPVEPTCTEGLASGAPRAQPSWLTLIRSSAVDAAENVLSRWLCPENVLSSSRLDHFVRRKCTFKLYWVELGFNDSVVDPAFKTTPQHDLTKEERVGVEAGPDRSCDHTLDHLGLNRSISKPTLVGPPLCSSAHIIRDARASMVSKGNPFIQGP